METCYVIVYETNNDLYKEIKFKLCETSNDVLLTAASYRDVLIRKILEINVDGKVKKCKIIFANGKLMLEEV